MHSRSEHDVTAEDRFVDILPPDHPHQQQIVRLRRTCHAQPEVMLGVLEFWLSRQSSESRSHD